MESFKKLEQYFEDLRTRKSGLQKNRVQLQAERQKLDGDFERAYLADSGHEEIQDQMGRVDFDLAAIDRKIHILDKAAGNSDTLTELAKAVLDEGRTLAEQLRADGAAQAERCVELREQYIEALSALGKIHRAGAGISYKCGVAGDHLPGPRQFVGVPDLWSKVKPDAGLCERKYNQKQY